MCIDILHMYKLRVCIALILKINILILLINLFNKKACFSSSEVVQNVLLFPVFLNLSNSLSIAALSFLANSLPFLTP